MVVLLAICVLVPAALLAWTLTRDDDRGGSGVVPLDRTRAKVGDTAPDFRLPDLSGRPTRLAEFRGKPVVLTFFASWCHPCEEELPALEKIQQEYGDRLQVLAVSYRDIDDDTRAFVDKLGVTYPTLLTDTADTSVARAYGVHGIPVTFFIDADGRVATEPLYGEGSRKALQPFIDEIVG